MNIPDNEFEITFVRSSGAGGQNVNKVATKAQLRWNLEKSNSLTSQQKELAFKVFASKLTIENELVLTESESRYQGINKENVIKKLHELLEKALTPRTPRKKTKIPRGAKMKRIEGKQKRGEVKRGRKVSRSDY